MNLKVGIKVSEIICIYRNNDYELKNKGFNDYDSFGKWVEKNAKKIIIVDVIKQNRTNRNAKI